jgi:hypothetical protein
MMRKLLLAIVVALSVGCGSAGQGATPATDTATPKVATNTPTPRPPTATPRPTQKPSPTSTPQPTWEPVTIAEVEAALTQAGYRRFPFTDSDGVNGFSWIDNNAYEPARTWENGMVQLEVLHDKSSQVRAEHVERHLTALDAALPAGFMAKLREENAAYNQSVAATVSGDPDHLYPFNDEWQTVGAEYFVHEVNLGGYWVDFSVWWWQSTCPRSASYCYYPGFPRLEFEGDSSFAFYSIYIWLPDMPAPSSSGA